MYRDLRLAKGVARSCRVPIWSPVSLAYAVRRSPFLRLSVSRITIDAVGFLLHTNLTDECAKRSKVILANEVPHGGLSRTTRAYAPPMADPVATARARAARPLLVLIANDQEWSARSLETVLGPRGYAVLRSYNARQTLDLARRVRPDVVIVDCRLPDGDGLDVCRTLREPAYLGPATPILVTSSDPGHRGQQLAAYAAGAWDYVLMPLDGEVLIHKLDTFTAAKREADRLREEGLLDPATGLYNARGLARRAREIGAEASRRGDALACVALIPAPADGSDFDEATAEDVVTRIAEQLGELLRRTGRTSDALGRLGRTEFAIIAPHTEAAGAHRLAERVREAVEAEQITTVSGSFPLPTAYTGDAPPTGSHATELGAHIHVRVGYYAVPDFAESSVDAVEMLVRAASALRQSASGSPESTIQEFSEVIPG
jgi:diguanylate cyclase (GGDEF)-like protein